MTKPNNEETLYCPLCGSDEYLLSNTNKFLCAECGSFFEDVDKIIVHQPHVQLLIHQRLNRLATHHAYH